MKSLDEELFEHLRIPESVLYLAAEGFDPELAFDLKVRSFGNWTFEYLKRYEEPPSSAAIEHDWEIKGGPEPEMAISYLLDKLRDRFVQKKRRNIIEKLVDETDSEKFTDLLVEESYRLWKTTSSQKHIQTLEDYPSAVDRLMEEAKHAEKGASFGFVPLDRISGGGKKGHLSFLVARPKRYKTWIGLKAFVEQRRQGMAPIFFSLELSGDEIYDRLLCLVSGVPYAKMMNKELTEDDWKLIRIKMGEFADLGPAYLINPPLEKRTVDDLMLEVQRYKADSVIIDQLSYLHWKGHKTLEHEGYREVVHNMKYAATKLDVPWYCMCQFNREAANLEDMADASMAGLTRAIEETCDIMIGLHRTKEMMEIDQVELGILVSRHSPNRNWMIDVDLNTTTSFLMKEER